MTVLLFPDNTVLVNFALIGRIDLLERIANRNGCWCATVASECARSARVPGLEGLRGVPAFLGESLRPESRAEYLDVMLLRTELARPGDLPHHHLGEAETLAIMIRRALSAVFVTDDGAARRLAAKHKVVTYSTWDLLRLAARTSLVDVDALWTYIQILRSERRGSPPNVTDRASVDGWLFGRR